MEENIKEKSKMRLCFGTFATVIKLCGQEDLTNLVLVDKIIKTIDPGSKYAEDKDDRTSAWKLVNCKVSFPRKETQEGRGTPGKRKPKRNMTKIVQLAKTVIKNVVICRIETDVIPLIVNAEQAILALLYIIQDDDYIENECKSHFEKCFGKTKDALLEQREYMLSEFLTSILFYTVEVDNRIGVQCVKEIQRVISKMADFYRNKYDVVWDSSAQKLTLNEKEIVLVDDNDSDSNEKDADWLQELFQPHLIEDDIYDFESEMREIFKQAIKTHRIRGFFKVANEPLNQNSIVKVSGFPKTIDDKIMNSFSVSQFNEKEIEMYNNIAVFRRKLAQYIEFSTSQFARYTLPSIEFYDLYDELKSLLFEIYGIDT